MISLNLVIPGTELVPDTDELVFVTGPQSHFWRPVWFGCELAAVWPAPRQPRSVHATLLSLYWPEVAQKVRAADGDWPLAAALLMSNGLRIESATLEDGERAAALWERGSGLSSADRFCLALGERLAATNWTADTGWGDSDTIRQVR